MKLMKSAILAGAAALAFTASVPADATRDYNNRGTTKGWNSSGWGGSGWGSSGWGSSGYGSTSSGGTGGTSTGGHSSTGGTQVPEPSNMLMLGLAGLIAGRLAARRRKKS